MTWVMVAFSMVFIVYLLWDSFLNGLSVVGVLMFALSCLLSFWLEKEFFWSFGKKREA